MTVLWLNLTIVFLFSLFSRYFSNTLVLNGLLVSIKPNKLLAFGTIISFILVSGLRNNIGDTFFYMHTYKINDFNWELIKSQDDIGFGVLQMILQRYSADPQILIFTTAMITNVLIIIGLYKYSRLFELSIYVYVTGGLFLVTMNGIRQCLATAILFTATKYLIEGNWFRYLLVVIFASLFHQSALILIPIYFLVRYKAWTKATMILLLGSAIIVLGFNQFSTILFSAIEDSQYGVYSQFSEGGANFIRVIVFAIPLVIAFFGREKLREIYPDSDVIVNMAIIGLSFMIISMGNWIFARFNIYFELYQIILLSWIVKVFREKDQRLVYYAILLCYFAYYFYESVINLNIIYRSNYLG
ncbi:EpsG family protein [Bacillus sp. EB106-08-02-XG196]|uniref:EpsG family protein n=1 Tax=Bacillus sp. EB106-08-02-XG196 TaxID=2737049 RepID=UPI0015C4E470|nr:EpsG family protein [Bacillus sp. EB106-08-02-XG196]NWQ39178.1 EpsG family protein [Bacillus sp. EB106-08-02-XG196]